MIESALYFADRRTEVALTDVAIHRSSSYQIHVDGMYHQTHDRALWLKTDLILPIR